MANIVIGRSYLLAEEDDLILNHDGVNTWYFDSSYTLHFLNSAVVSIIENTFTYTGGAHGSSRILGHNFNNSPVYKIELQNLFLYDDYETVLEFISNFCFKELIGIQNEWSELSDKEIAEQDKSMFFEHSLDPVWENFKEFLMSRESISIIFNQYQIAPYAFGMHLIDIPFREFKKLKINLEPLLKLEEKLKY